MRINWKRFSIGAFLLASLSLLLFGCGDSGSSKTGQDAATKTISGIVSDTETGLPLPRAKVTAYAIDDNGVESTTPLSLYSVITDLQGRYTLLIPADYSNSVLVVAEPGGQLPKQASKLSKVASALATTNVIRSVVGESQVQMDVIPPVMVSFATEMVYVFVTQTESGVFSPDNIRTATIVLEVFFGPNFSQIEPPTSTTDTNVTQAQQDLLVSIRALSAVITASLQTDYINTIVTELVSEEGLGSIAQVITTAIDAAVETLKEEGALPVSYVPSAVIEAAITAAASGITLPDLTDITPPTAPASLSATLASGNVNLSWTASVDSGEGASGLSGYLIYRADSSGEYLLINMVGQEATSYLDISAASATSYLYKVVAYDASRNFSEPGISGSVTTTAAVYTISGKVTQDGVGLAGATVTKGSTSVVTDSLGNYTFTGVANGSYVLTPSFSGFYRFTPESLTATVSSVNLTGQDFTAVFSGTIIGGVAYPEGAIGGGVTYPTGTVIGGVTYPTATVVGGVTYPTGVVTGGVLYPNGVVIGGVSYPAGTVVGGIAYPVGTVTGSILYPDGLVSATIDWSLSGTPRVVSVNPVPPSGP